MSETTVEQNEDVVAETTVGEVMEAQKVATLEQFKRLPEVRLSQATPFTIPGTDITVMVAKWTGTDKYVCTLQQVKYAESEDEDERTIMLKALNNGIVKACVVQPKLDDEAIDALNAYNADGLEALIAECLRVSSNGKFDATQVTESFSSGNPAITS